MVIGTADVMLVKMCVCFTVQQRGVIIMFVYFIHYHPVQDNLLDVVYSSQQPLQENCLDPFQRNCAVWSIYILCSV